VKATDQRSTTLLTDRIITALCPALARKLSERETQLAQQEVHLENEKGKFKSTKERHEREFVALKDGLLQVTQQELDAAALEHDQTTKNLLAATAAQHTATVAALAALANTDAISMSLTEALNNANARSANLEVLASAAKTERSKTAEHLRRAQAQATYFELATNALLLVQAQAEIETTDEDAEEILRQGRLEVKNNWVVLKEAQRAFTNSRASEIERLANGHARLEEWRAAVAVDAALAKKEKERARIVAVAAEQERAASVDAMDAAMKALEAAVIRGEEAERLLGKIMGMADEMEIPMTVSNVTTIPSIYSGATFRNKAEVELGGRKAHKATNGGTHISFKRPLTSVPGELELRASLVFVIHQNFSFLHSAAQEKPDATNRNR
jgi:hypothetical protein